MDADFFVRDISECKIGLKALKCDWHDVVIDYTHRRLSFPDDKLTAMAALASKFRQLGAGEYLAGLWSSSLITDLMWMVPPAERAIVPRSRPVHYRAPSWSWAAIDGSVAFTHYVLEKATYEANVIRCETVPRSIEVPTGNVVSGILEIQGRVKPAFHNLGSHDVFDMEDDGREHPMFKAYMDTKSDEDEYLYCLKLDREGSDLLLRNTSDHYSRVGFFERSFCSDKGMGWFDDASPTIILIR